MVYVGDNPEKDFQASRQLGMGRICFNNPDGIYKSSVEDGITEITDVLKHVLRER